MNSKIKIWQVALLLLTIAPITKFILLPASLSKTLQQDSYILIGIFILLDIIALSIILNCHKKNPNLTFYQILEGSFGKVMSKIIIALYLSFFFMKTLAPLIEQKRMLAGNLYETIPKISTLIPFFILAAYISYKGWYAIGRNANILGFVSLVSVILIIVLSLGNVDFSNLLPVMDRPASQLYEGFNSTLIWFGDFTIILFMLGKISNPKGKIKSVVWCYIVAQALILIFYIILISIYGEITERQSHAISKISKFNTALTNIGRFDWIPIILLMLCHMMAAVCTFYCSYECLTYLLPNCKKIILLIILVAVYCLAAFLIQDNIKMLLEFFYRYYSYVAYLLQYVLPFILPLLSLIQKRKVQKFEKIKNKKFA